MSQILLFFACMCIANVTPSLREKRLIGGKPIHIEDAPYQVILVNTETMDLCSGSIIGSNLVLTAAHCVLEDEEDYVIKSGATKQSRGAGTLHEIDGIIRHEKFQRDRFGRLLHDIALVVVYPPFEIDNRVRSIVKLANPDYEIKTGKSAVITGWGLTESGRASDQLRTLTVDIMSPDECNEEYEDVEGIADGQFCAMSSEGKRNFCIGDSGGPLMIDGHQVGIVSWIELECADHPGVYTKVSDYRDWVDKQIKTYSLSA